MKTSRSRVFSAAALLSFLLLVPTFVLLVVQIALQMQPDVLPGTTIILPSGRQFQLSSRTADTALLVIAVALAILPALWIARLIRRLPTVNHSTSYCTHCGYDIRASKDRCPECGTPIAASHSR